MKWSEQFLRGTFRLFSGNTLEGFQPIDFYHFFPLWYDLWLHQLSSVLDKLEIEKKSYREVAHLLPGPSSLRAILIKIIPTYKGYSQKNPAEVRKVVEFLVRMLQECCPDDPFAETSNRFISDRILVEMRAKAIWHDSTPAQARIIGQLTTAAGSHVHGLYNDLVTDLGWDTYGPYQEHGGELLIRHFPNLSPSELWPPQFLAAKKELIIFTTYQGVEWEIASVGCHTVVKSGSPVLGMKKIAVLADGIPLQAGELHALIEELTSKAEAVYKKIRSMNMESIKEMVLLQECYQFKTLFESVGIEWRPTEEMKARIYNKPFAKDILPHGKMMGNLEEYRDALGIDSFMAEVFGSQGREVSPTLRSPLEEF